MSKLFFFLCSVLFFMSCAGKKENHYPQIVDMIQSQYPMFVSVAPNGEKVLLKSRRETFDLFISDIDTLKPYKIDSSEFTQLSLTWHPDGRKIAFQEFNPKSNKFDLYILDIELKARKLIGLPKSNNAIPPLKWSHSGKYLAYLMSTDAGSTLFVYDFSRDEIKWSFRGLDPYSDFQWSKDSILFFTENPKKPILKEVHVSSGEIKYHELKDIEEIHKFSIKEGKVLVVGRGKRDEYFQCFEQDLKSRESFRLTNGNFNVSNCTYSMNESNYYYYTRNENGLSKLYCSDKKINLFLKDISKKGNGFDLDLEKERHLYVTNRGSNTPPYSVKLDLVTGKKEIIYKSPYKDSEKQIDLRVLNIENRTSKSQVNAFFWPSENSLGMSKKTILYVHGGPFLQTKPTWDIRTQILNRYGINLLAINYHGSSGYSKKFAEEKDISYQISDIVASISFLKQNYNIEEKDIVLMGSSYGGNLVTKVVDYISDIKGIVLISGDIDSNPIDKLKKTKILGFYGKLDPLTFKVRSVFDKFDLLDSRKTHFKFFEKEGHLFHKSSSWAQIYNDIIHMYYIN